jgi:hypothetical protein
MCKQATSAPVGALPSATEISTQRAACATMPAAIGNPSRRHGIEKKVLNEAAAHPLTVLSTIGVNPAAAFNRAWQREGILNARFEKLLELNTTALILKSLGVARSNSNSP